MTSFYEPCDPSEDIEQGQIFANLPFLNSNSSEIVELIVEGERVVKKRIDLKDYVGTGNDSKNIAIEINLSPAIIISQNCDIVRKNSSVSYCAIRSLDELNKISGQSEKNQIIHLTKNYKDHFKYYYLPPNSSINFKERKAVDFSSIHQINVDVLRNIKNKRVAKLNKDLPLEHFKEKLAYYFKRFAYDSWYVLTKEEFAIYRAEMEKTITDQNELQMIKPLPWQEN